MARKILITRGIQGSGKSTWIRENNLSQFTISRDAVRLLFASPILELDGNLAISQKNNARVASFIRELVEARMSHGEFLIVDGMHLRQKDVNMFIDLAKKYLYDLAIVDFSHVTLEAAISQNDGRESYKFIPHSVIKDCHAVITQEKISGAKILDPRTNDFETWLYAEYERNNVDLSSYKKIHHIGDIQGCYSVLQEYVKDGLKDDEYYIFTGDLLDRGIENGKVLKWAVENITNKKNVTLILGNHETHLIRWVADLPAVSEEFKQFTLPQIIEENIKRTRVHALLRGARDYLIYEIAGKKVLVTHAGISKMPEDLRYVLSTISSHQLWKGVGTYGEQIDKQFEHNVDWIQVHGHRNTKCLPIQASSNSFLLEGQVEFGGNLRVVTFENNNGSLVVDTKEIENTVFKTYKDRLENEQTRSIDPIDAPLFVNQPGFSNIVNADLITELNNHTLVRGQSFGNVVSYSFTKKAFYDAAWDDVNVKARGLFIDKNTNEVVARSYEKFFNLGERQETKIESLKQNLVFPVEVFNKENGFLGIVGYNSDDKSLFITSKSNPDSEFAENFRRIFNNTFSESQKVIIKRFLRDQQASLIFEVIDPVADPHMIEYDREQIILLDIVARSENFMKASYEQVKTFADKFNVGHKQRIAKFQRWENLEGWMNNIEGDDLMNPKHASEGYVIEDAVKFQFKIKSPYYSFWKNMRGNKDRIVSTRLGNKEFTRKIFKNDDLANKFLDWAEKQTTETLKKDIITLRKLFNND